MTTSVCAVDFYSGDILGAKVSRNGGKTVECLGLETNCIVDEFAIGKDDGGVKGVKEEVNIKKVDPLENIVVENKNGDEVKEALKIFPDTYVCPEIKMIQFGSFGVPRLDDEEKLKEQIKIAKVQFDEKIRRRYAISVEIQENEAILESHSKLLKAADMEIIAANKLVRSKRSNLDSIQCLMKKVTMTEDNWHILEVEQMREVVNQKYEIEARLKNLDKEVQSLKDNLLQAQVASLLIGDIYEEQKEKIKELQAQFLVADEVCQQAYTHLYSLKKRLCDKNKLFFMYKKDVMAARNSASGGDKTAIPHLCATQMERFMEERNTNSRIRPSTLDETLCVSDMSGKVATSPVPIPSEKVGTNSISIPSQIESVPVVSKIEEGKKTVLCVSDTGKQVAMNSVLIPSKMESVSAVPKVEEGEKMVLCVRDLNERGATDSVSIPSEIESVPVVSKVEEGKKTVLCVSDMGGKVAMNSVVIPNKMESISVVPKVEEGEKTVLCVSDLSERVATNSVPITNKMGSVLMVEQGKQMASPLNNQTMWKAAGKTNRIIKTEEPLKFAVKESKFSCLSEIMEDEEKEKTVVAIDRKEDELSKKDIECNLKEQIRLKEKRKMNKAIERKKRNAEIAQKRADLQAQKEAEQKEKARNKRLRKKERKRTGGDNIMNDENIVKPNETNETENLQAKTLTTRDNRWGPQWWKMVTAPMRFLYSC